MNCYVSRGCRRKGIWPTGLAWALTLFMLAGLGACAGSQKQKAAAESHLNLGMAYVDSGDYTAALKELLEAERNDPKNPQIHYYLSIVYYGKGYNDKALAEGEKAVQLKPDYSVAYNFLGTVYYSQGQYEKAVAAFKKALDDMLYETPSLALYNMGKAYYRLGDYNQALARYRQAEAKDSRQELLPLIEQETGRVKMAQGDIESAVAHFKKATELAPVLVEAHYLLGECYLKQRKHAEARRAYETVVRLSPASDFGVKAKQALKFMDI